LAGTDGVSLEAEKWADIREALGVAPYEMLNLQPTRVVQRKSIEHAIERVHQLGLKAKLVISHASGDDTFHTLSSNAGYKMPCTCGKMNIAKSD
jgi:hypothetical protein